MNTKTINLGSGLIYILPYEGSIPGDEIIESSVNLLGLVKDGCTITYTPAYQDNVSREGNDAKALLTEEELLMNFGLITWDASTISYLSPTSSISISDTVRTLRLGGINNYVDTLYLLRFKHLDTGNRVTILASSRSLIEFGYRRDAETIVNCTFKAKHMADGSLLVFRDSTVDPEPTTIYITRNGSYNVIPYDRAVVTIPLPGPDFWVEDHTFFVLHPS